MKDLKLKVIVDGRIGRLNKTKIIHHPFSKGIFHG